MSDHQPANKFKFERLFLKDLSFETPMGAAVFSGGWDPDYKVKLRLNSEPLTDGNWEVILIATVTVALGSGTAYMVEAQQGAVVSVTEEDRDALRRILAVDVPEVMFPYLREVVDNVAVKGGFPAVAMSRPDFAGWHEQASLEQSLQAGWP